MHLNAVLHVGSGDDAESTAEFFERRKSIRKSVTLKTPSNSPVGEEMSVAIKDISPQGFLIEAESDALWVGEVIDIDLPGSGIVTGRVVWASNRYFGCQLNTPISPGAIGATLLREDIRLPYNSPAPEVRGLDLSRQSQDGKFKPELNFSVAFYLALLSWAVIALAIYLVVR